MGGKHASGSPRRRAGVRDSDLIGPAVPASGGTSAAAETPARNRRRADRHNGPRAALTTTIAAGMVAIATGSVAYSAALQPLAGTGPAPAETPEPQAPPTVPIPAQPADTDDRAADRGTVSPGYGSRLDLPHKQQAPLAAGTEIGLPMAPGPARPPATVPGLPFEFDNPLAPAPAGPAGPVARIPAPVPGAAEQVIAAPAHRAAGNTPASTYELAHLHQPSRSVHGAESNESSGTHVGNSEARHSGSGNGSRDRPAHFPDWFEHSAGPGRSTTETHEQPAPAPSDGRQQDARDDHDSRDDRKADDRKADDRASGTKDDHRSVGSAAARQWNSERWFEPGAAERVVPDEDPWASGDWFGDEAAPGSWTSEEWFDDGGAEHGASDEHETSDGDREKSDEDKSDKGDKGKDAKDRSDSEDERDSSKDDRRDSKTDSKTDPGDSKDNQGNSKTDQGNSKSDRNDSKDDHGGSRDSGDERGSSNDDSGNDDDRDRHDSDRSDDGDQDRDADKKDRDADKKDRDGDNDRNRGADSDRSSDRGSDGPDRSDGSDRGGR